MKLNLTKPPVDLDDKIMEGKTLGQIVAFQLASDNKNDPLKFLEWAQTLHKEGIVDLDSSDQKTFETFVTKCDQMPNLFKGQVLQAMDNAKNQKK